MKTKNDDLPQTFQNLVPGLEKSNIILLEDLLVA